MPKSTIAAVRLEEELWEEKTRKAVDFVSFASNAITVLPVAFAGHTEVIGGVETCRGKEKCSDSDGAARRIPRNM
jgi:hypothetical protein